MPNFEIGLNQREKINAAHVEYTRQTGAIETIIEGPPVFSGTMQSGQTLIVSQGFLDFLKANDIPERARPPFPKLEA
jgi:hypothetical protein